MLSVLIGGVAIYFGVTPNEMSNMGFSKQFLLVALGLLLIALAIESLISPDRS